MQVYLFTTARGEGAPQGGMKWFDGVIRVPNIASWQDSDFAYSFWSYLVCRDPTTHPSIFPDSHFFLDFLILFVS